MGIWDDERCNKSVNGDIFECGWCGLEARPAHTKRAKAHVAKIPGQGIKICPAIIPDNYLQRYRDLWDRDNARKQASVNSKKRKEQLVEERQLKSTSSLITKRSKLPGTGGLSILLTL